MFKFRDSDPAAAVDSRTGDPIYRFQSIAAVPWSEFAKSPGTSFRIIVQQSPEHLPLDIQYIPRDHHRLLVGFHGAEAQSQTELPRFQFARSIGLSRKESFLAVSDPTMLYSTGLSVTWMVGNEDFDAGAEYAALIRDLMDSTGVNETVLVGHSAGGTSAIRVGSQIPGSTAVAVNPQLTASDHRAYLTSQLRKEVFPHFSTDSGFLHAYRNRLDLRVALENRAEGSTFHWYGHAEDRLQFTDHPHFLIACDWLGLPPGGGITTQGDQMIRCSWKTSNENKHAMPGGIEPFLQRSLGEPYKLDLGIAEDFATLLTH